MNIKNTDNQEVSAALDLLTSTLKEEKTRIFNAGSKAMEAQDAETAWAVLEFAKKLEGFTGEVQSLITKWNVLLQERETASPTVQEIVTGEGKLFGVKPRKSSKGFTRKVTHPLAPKTNFYVRFVDGTVIQMSKAADTLAQAIDKIGAERIAPLGVLVNGEPLVSKEDSVKYPGKVREISNGYKVIIHSSTSGKMKQLKKISDLLQLNLEIELL